MKPWFWVFIIICAIIAPPSIPALIFAGIGYLMWENKQSKKEAARMARLDPEYLEDLARHEEERKRLGL